MKQVLAVLAAVVLGPLAPAVWAQTSVGNYRIPYASGLLTTTLLDHISHPLTNRVTLKCIDATANPTNFFVVAAEDGFVRVIRDLGGPGPNFVWIEHTNTGEWTGYFFMRQGSVTSRANLAVNDFVVAGQIIGVEGQVGAPPLLPGSQLRFEVGVPDDPSSPVDAGGNIKGVSRIPIICNIPGNLFQTNRTYDPSPCVAMEFSYGTYRMPYSNSVQFRVSRDHLTHAPSKTRYDLVGQGGVGSPYPIAAAADGIIRMIVDNNTTNCLTCSAFNNYVWISHPNGEWSKYTHFAPNSVRGKAGLKVGDFVAAGTYLGDEDQIGAASGVHLHFEVATIYDQSTNSIDPSGGFLDLDRGANRIPLFCDVVGNIAYGGDVFTASPCSGGGAPNNIVVPAKIIRNTDAHIANTTVDTGNNNVHVDTYGSLALYAGQKVTLRPGFKALNKSYVRAAVQPAFNPP